MPKDNALIAQREQIAKQVGLALAQWTIVEAALAYLFVALLDRTKSAAPPGMTMWSDEDRGRRMGHTIIDAIVNFEARVDVVGALVKESGINKKLRALWPGLAARLSKGYKKRHQIAHFMITNVEQDDGTWKAALTPFAVTVGSYSETRLGVAEIDKKAEVFRDLLAALVWFREAVEISRGRRKEPLEPEPPVIRRVREALRAQTRQAPPPRPEPSRR